MTIKELIEQLSKYDENTEVRVQYRDDGGCYAGSEEPWTDMYEGVLYL